MLTKWQFLQATPPKLQSMTYLTATQRVAEKAAYLYWQKQRHCHVTDHADIQTTMPTYRFIVSAMAV